MKDLLKKPITFEKVEFWAATAFYVFSIYVLAYNQYIQILTGSLHTPNVYLFQQYRMPYSYSKDYFIPQFFINTAFYGSFLLLNFWIIKQLINGQRIFLNIILLLTVAILTAVIFGTADTWIKSYLFHSHSERYLYRLVFKQETVFTFWLLIIFGLYIVLKLALKNGLSKANLNFEDKNSRDMALAFSIWLLIVFLQTITLTPVRTALAWCEPSLFGIIVYGNSYRRIIPQIVIKGGNLGDLVKKLGLLLIIACIPISIFFFLLYHRTETAFIITFFNLSMGVFAGGLSWFVYHSRRDKTIELQGLKTDLGRSSANLDFLRSQINPHFLFNALNTLYGTSLQENAERTGEGIQKLGDMMRFMLQENTQERISLAREVDYLNNYIDLQKLRTQTSSDILINTEIEGQLIGLEIAPMLLIPFVENAFKHGISLREPSHIQITLQTRENELLFDVYNSIHLKAGNDPEKNKSGIGLENVKQRLQLLYPDRYELVVRESAKEFFIHLTLQL